jgi:hypothetical protein
VERRARLTLPFSYFAYASVLTGLTRFRSPNSRTIAAFHDDSVVSHDPPIPPTRLAQSVGRYTTRTFAAFEYIINSLTVPKAVYNSSLCSLIRTSAAFH